MDLTWLVGTSLLLVGIGYAFVQKAPRFRLVCWSLLCASLFALATRDLFRTREQGRPAPRGSDVTRRRAPDRPDHDEKRRPSLFARLRRRIASWRG